MNDLPEESKNKEASLIEIEDFVTDPEIHKDTNNKIDETLNVNDSHGESTEQQIGKEEKTNKPPKRTLDCLLRNLDTQPQISRIEESLQKLDPVEPIKSNETQIFQTSNSALEEYQEIIKNLKEKEAKKESLFAREVKQNFWRPLRPSQIFPFCFRTTDLKSQKETVIQINKKNKPVLSSQETVGSVMPKKEIKQDLLSMAGFANHLKQQNNLNQQEKQNLEQTDIENLKTDSRLETIIRKEIKECFQKLILPQISQSLNELNSQVLSKFEKLTKGITKSNGPNEPVLNVKYFKELINQQNHLKILQTEALVKLFNQKDLFVHFVESCDINVLINLESRKLFELLKLTNHVFEADHFVYGILSFLNVYSLSAEECRELNKIMVLINQGVWFVNDGPPAAISAEVKSSVAYLKNSIIRKMKGVI
ncbi:hypothetical protein CDIK_0131 [Cucumispora dikerogammari]|nr:hypothetical protein CDIK_0131 [Cucumispora dikerogammari]